MMKQPHKFCLVIWGIGLALGFIFSLSTPLAQVRAAHFLQFTPFDTIKLEMFALRADGSIDTDNYADPHCSSTGETRYAYGCTWFTAAMTRMEVYPFESYDIEIGYQSEIRDGYEQGYLHNVVPQELSIEQASQENKALSAIQAQTIAARTFAFHHAYIPSTPDETRRLNNTATSYQVYIPFRYEALNTDQKQRVDAAVASVLYMTLPDDTDPIRAHFGADNDEWTTEGATSYLKSIYDPINADYGADVGTGYGGMSSRGASRWGFGHTSSWGPVARENSNYPHDKYGNGDLWSIRYDAAQQILTHYYTGIAIRDIDENILTPEYRWLPLKADWGNGMLTPPENMQPGNGYNMTLVLQNAGTVDWDDNVSLTYRWLRGSAVVGTPGNIDVSNLVQGAGDVTTQIEDWTIVVPAELRVGDEATLVFDMRNDTDPAGIYFSNREAVDKKKWFDLRYHVCIGGVCNLHLPLALRNHFVCPEEKNLIQNGGFEQGHTIWVEQAPAAIIRSRTDEIPIVPYEGNWLAWLGGYNNAQDTLYQEFILPHGAQWLQLHYAVAIETQETEPVERDYFRVHLRRADGTLIQTLATSSNVDEEYVWFITTISVEGLTDLWGERLWLSFEATTNDSLLSSFVLDEVSLLVKCEIPVPSEGPITIITQPAQKNAPLLNKPMSPSSP